jgi:(1->4)-alpha-D-glucan 1-alpha-D-glucosylmutase
MDVLEAGAGSKYRGYFDIDWEHQYESLRGRLLAPFLGEFYGTCLDRADIGVRFQGGGFIVAYGEFAFPLRIEDYAWVMKLHLPTLEREAGPGSAELGELLGIVKGFETLSGAEETADRRSRASSLKTSLEALYRRSAEVAGYIDSVLGELNGVKDEPRTFDKLDELLARQHFRFSFWKVGNEELNYRRFFTVNDLVGLRTEESEVFEFLHGRIVGLVRAGKISGLRIDHLDGLSAPLAYIRKLRESLPDVYVVAEKILDLFEELHPEMAFEGTTGYDFLNFANAVFVDKHNEKKFNDLYVRFTGMSTSYGELVTQKKRLFMGTRMAGEIDNLAHLLRNILGASRYGRDMTNYGLKRGLVEVLAHFPVYRTYVSPGHLSPRDEAYIKEAVARAKNNQPGLANELDLIERTLLLHYGPETPEPERREWEHFTARFQQLSVALMAKGAEDTTFYVYNRLLSLNEVGGNPSVFGISVRDFHEFNARRIRQWPHSLNATATHDTKRGEDARARLNVLSEMPKEWGAAVRAFAKANARLKMPVGARSAPDVNDEYLIYESLLGAYPFAEEDLPNLTERMKAYIVKAIREAKVHTAWVKPDVAYEQTCVDFVDAILDRSRSSDFLSSFLPLEKKIAFYGVFNSLSQLVLKLCSPGVPDTYQGGELWDFNFVDPDNRRSVDFEKRKRILVEIKSREGDLPALARDLVDHREDGRVKLFAIYRLLKARNESRELFMSGEYIPLETSGTHRDRVIAFARRSSGACSVTVAPRLLSRIVEEGVLPLGSAVWRDTAVLLPDGLPGRWNDVFTGRDRNGARGIIVGEALESFPVSVLVAGR